ncbi:MAG: hypothetical protein Q4G15_08765 [Lachnospiraceae bacterium]|nr:hypothetical protein [Lachnospiraceae bacterium]
MSKIRVGYITTKEKEQEDQKQIEYLRHRHVGSASSLIAAHDAGLQYVGFEL